MYISFDISRDFIRINHPSMDILLKDGCIGIQIGELVFLIHSPNIRSCNLCHQDEIIIIINKALIFFTPFSRDSILNMWDFLCISRRRFLVLLLILIFFFFLFWLVGLFLLEYTHILFLLPPFLYWFLCNKDNS